MTITCDGRIDAFRRACAYGEEMVCRGKSPVIDEVEGGWKVEVWVKQFKTESVRLPHLDKLYVYKPWRPKKKPQIGQKAPKE